RSAVNAITGIDTYWNFLGADLGQLGDASHAPASRLPPAAAIWAGNDFQQMAARVLEIDAASAVVMVDLPRLGPRRIGPMGEALFFHAGEDLVELRLAHQESVVLRPDLALLVHKIDVDPVCGRDDLERSPFFRCREAQHASKERRRSLAVTRPDNSVVEFDTHGRLVTFPRSARSRRRSCACRRTASD